MSDWQAIVELHRIYVDARRNRPFLDDPALLESDRNRVVGGLTDITRIMLRSIRAMSPGEKQSVRDALDLQMNRTRQINLSGWNLSLADIEFLRRVGIRA